MIKSISDLEQLTPEERINLLKQKSERKSSRPMSYIYPQKIREILENIDLRNTTFKEHEKLSIMRVPKEYFHLQRCPQCNNRMEKTLDIKFYKMRNKCFDCVIKDEHQIRLNGEWDEYEKWKISENKLSWLKDVRDETEDYLENGLKQTYKYVKEDGHIEKWRNPEYEKTKIFIQDKLEEVKKYIIELEQEVIKLREKFIVQDILQKAEKLK